METQLEKINAVECRVRVQIPWEEISPRFDKKMRELQGSARLPGFRPGKVPSHMVERMFGKNVRDELARDIVQETFQSAVSKHDRVPLTQPVLEEGTLTKGQTFTYAARFEVPPEIQPKDYTGVPVRRRPSNVDETKVDAQIKAKQDELTELRAIAEGTERATHAGDTWTLDIDGKLGDVNVSRKDVRLEIGDATEYLPGLSKALEGTPLSAVGSTRTITFLPTQERIRADLREKEAVLTIGFRDVREKHVPKLDDEFARDSGEADSLEALRAKYADNVREEDQNEAERDARKRLVEALLERNNFEVAPSLVAREVAAQVDLFKRQLQQQGIKLNQTGMSEQQVASQMRPQALFNVKAFLLLDAIGKVEGLVVDEAEVDKELQNLAEEQGQNVDRLRATMEKNNQLLLLRAQIREEKILDFLMGKAEVTEAPDPAPENASAESGSETAGGDTTGETTGETATAT